MRDPRPPAPGGSSVPWGMALTAGLMVAFDAGLVFAFSLIRGVSILSLAGFSGLIWLMGLQLAGTAAGGAAGVRVAGLNWRRTAFAGVLAGAVLLLLSRFEFSPLFPGPWTPAGTGMVLDLRAGALYLVLTSAGVFLLPLIDPTVRRTGPAVSRPKAALAAAALALLALLADYLMSTAAFQGLSTFGLLTMVLGSVLAAGLTAVGLVLALLGITAAGAWLGAVALLLEGFAAAAWWLLGGPFFP